MGASEFDGYPAVPAFAALVPGYALRCALRAGNREWGMGSGESCVWVRACLRSLASAEGRKRMHHAHGRHSLAMCLAPPRGAA